jgi:hypothetical protein
MAWQDEQHSGVQNSSFPAVNKLEYLDASGVSRRQAIQRTGVAAAQSDCWNRPAPCPQWGQRAGRKVSLILGRRPPLLTRSSPSAQAACRLSRFQCAGTPYQSQDWCRHYCSEIGINPGFFRMVADLFVRRAVVRPDTPTVFGKVVEEGMTFARGFYGRALSELVRRERPRHSADREGASRAKRSRTRTMRLGKPRASLCRRVVWANAAERSAGLDDTARRDQKTHHTPGMSVPPSSGPSKVSSAAGAASTDGPMPVTEMTRPPLLVSVTSTFGAS